LELFDGQRPLGPQQFSQSHLTLRAEGMDYGAIVNVDLDLVPVVNEAQHAGLFLIAEELQDAGKKGRFEIALEHFVP